MSNGQAGDTHYHQGIGNTVCKLRDISSYAFLCVIACRTDGFVDHLAHFMGAHAKYPRVDAESGQASMPVNRHLDGTCLVCRGERLGAHPVNLLVEKRHHGVGLIKHPSDLEVMSRAHVISVDSRGGVSDSRQQHY
ncbi:hypothetical protein MGAST_12990 [Mycobacterium gastri 'Wayne']|uniref:Uncharacterized protein n=1 Tax=Mycobacterium gastri TaxID=1777 RepID=A0A1X1V9Y6_MYCGS|nr:hypothetical protein [Mycobacterium gastri]ETW23626.1 hypothetical protein MGAST_12990 [Mycobacterium gastri 'Wayne']ORV65877.1 hypothetical protein AWC07_12530 [Mycobacterium gastri]